MQAEIDVINESWNVGGTSNGLADSVGLMVYEGTQVNGFQNIVGGFKFNLKEYVYMFTRTAEIDLVVWGNHFVIWFPNPLAPDIQIHVSWGTRRPFCRELYVTQ